MCNQFTFHHKFRIDTGMSKFEQQTEILTRSTWQHRVLHNTCTKHGRNIKITVLGRRQPCSEERIEVPTNKIERNYPLRHAPSLLYPEGYHDGNWRNHFRESICVTSTSFKDVLLKIIGWKNWIQKLLEVVKTPNKSNQNPHPIIKHGETCEWATTWFAYKGNRKRCLVWRCESTNSRTVRPVKSCVPVSVERLYKDKDADKNVDADQTSTGRPVSGQPTGLFTQREEIEIDFRVSGLPHAVVKQTENFRVRELVKQIENHPHRQALQAVQQNNITTPFRDDSKAMIREMGNVELFELCETIPKVQRSQCLFIGIKGMICCTCGQLLVESESSQNFNKWRLDALSVPLRNQEGASSWCSAR